MLADRQQGFSRSTLMILGLLLALASALATNVAFLLKQRPGAIRG